MAPKRTYNRYNLSIAKRELEPSDPENIYSNANKDKISNNASKRRKPTPPSPVSAMHHSHVMNGGGRPKSINRKGATTKSHKGATKSFSGPTSLPSDEMDLDQTGTNGDSFESALARAQGKKTPKLPQTSIYGGGSSSVISYSAQLKNLKRGEKQKEAQVDVIEVSSVDGELQHPQNVQSEVIDLGSDDMDTSMDSSSIADVTLRGGGDLSAAEASERIFQGREYTAPQTTPPRHTLCGPRIKAGSVLALAWSANQTGSPLLRLPANVRRTIFEYALGGNSIEFGFVSYLNNKTTNDDSIAYFQYTSNVYSDRRNPFHGTTLPLHADPKTTGMTLLNGVCRQLYFETYKLPYALNTFYFNSSNALFNFVVQEARLQLEQRKAITSLVLLHRLPGPAVLESLPNLQCVYLMAAIPTNIGEYKVVREGKEPKLMKVVSGSGFAAGKLNKPTMRGGGYDSKFNSRTAYGGSGASYGCDDLRGRGSDRCKSSDEWWRR